MKCNFFLFLLIPFMLSVVACDRIPEDLQGDEMARFNAWIAVNKISEEYKTASGMYVIPLQIGTGAGIVDSNYVLYNYVARNLDGVVFETTYKDTADLYGIKSNTTHYVPAYKQYITNEFSIKGINEIFGTLKEGAKVRLIMPSSLAYGKTQTTFLPSYTSIIYDLELKKVVVDPEVYEKSLIDEYILANPGFTLVSDSVYYKKISDGTKTTGIAKDSIVKYNYIGRFLDGFIFDTNVKKIAQANGIYNTSQPDKYYPMEFSVGVKDDQSPIPGIHVAVKSMQQGEKAYIIIPSKYAYGAASTSSIQPYSPLIFELEITNVDPKLHN